MTTGHYNSQTSGPVAQHPDHNHMPVRVLQWLELQGPVVSITCPALMQVQTVAECVVVNGGPSVWWDKTLTIINTQKKRSPTVCFCMTTFSFFLFLLYKNNTILTTINTFLKQDIFSINTIPHSLLLIEGSVLFF